MLGKAGGKAAGAPSYALPPPQRPPASSQCRRGIGDAIVKLVAVELIVVQGVAELHVVGIAPTDQHVGLGDAKGEGVQFLAKAGDIRIGIQLLQPLLHAGKHLAGAHGHVVDRLGDAIPVEGVLVASHQQIAHQVNDVPAGEVRSGLLVVGLGKPLDQVFKDVPHIHGADLLRPHIRLVGAEVHDHLIEQASLLHAVDLGTEIHAGENVLHIVRKSR